MTEPTQWGRLVRTVRHLTPRQIAGRISLVSRFRLYDRFPGVARIGLDGPATLDGPGVERVRRWLATRAVALTPRQAELARDAAEGRFTFLGRSQGADGAPPDWRAAAMTPLWRYHLHYQDYVAALARGDADRRGAGWGDRAIALMEDWIAGNPTGRRPGWDPYPISLRIVNWIIALAALDRNGTGTARAVASLAAQTRFLARHLEWHLGGNHLLKNAKALAIAGVAFHCREAPVWRRRGARLFLDEIRVQVLADGGHYERSPLYHGIVLEDVLDLLVLAQQPDADLLPRPEIEELSSAARRMADWLALMRHPDGGLALFNDCVVAGDPDPAALLAYAARVLAHEPPAAPAVAALPASGYYVLQRGEGRAVVDCGEVGPDELPAHAHADTLSFELTWSGERVVVDSGTPEYAMDDLRRYVRSTAAHNTVRVDETEQSEVWGSHRVGRRARPAKARVVERGDHVGFAGAHDGYAGMGVIHHRHIVAAHDAWFVVDELRGRGRHRFESHLHLHPDLRLRSSENEWGLGGRGDLRVRAFGAVRCEPARGWYCPDWGQVLAAPLLTIRGEAEAPALFGFVIAPRRTEVQVEVAADAAGITLDARIDGRPLRLRSDRCTFSS
jgi:uncharacterized heparinase superfamily protein